MWRNTPDDALIIIPSKRHFLTITHSYSLWMYNYFFRQTRCDARIDIFHQTSLFNLVVIISLLILVNIYIENMRNIWDKFWDLWQFYTFMNSENIIPQLRHVLQSTPQTIGVEALILQVERHSEDQNLFLNLKMKYCPLTTKYYIQQ